MIDITSLAVIKQQIIMLCAVKMTNQTYYANRQKQASIETTNYV